MFALSGRRLRSVGACCMRQRLVCAPRTAIKCCFKRCASSSSANSSVGWWKSPQFWGTAGATAGWGMSLAAIYDASFKSPEVISVKMTTVMLVYSSLFARWSWQIIPINPFLGWCHLTNIVAQSNQMHRALQHKWENGKQEEVKSIAVNLGAGAMGLVALISAAPMMQARLLAVNIPSITPLAKAAAGPFTVHFWAPMSKWLISGASFLELNRPTDKISIAQYSALTATGFFFTRYSLLVIPINYMLCSVNVALFLSSAWHLCRKINADFIGIGLGDVNTSDKAKSAQHTNN